jgi:hypothetical protein
MPYTWNMSKVEYYKDNPDKIWVKTRQFGEQMDDVNPEAKAIIFGMMSVGMSGISENNVAEFYGRWKVMEMLENLYVTAMVTDTGDLDKTFMSPNLAKKYIGIGTNNTYSSLTRWAIDVSKAYPKYKSSDIKSIVQFYSLEYREEMGLL